MSAPIQKKPAKRTAAYRAWYDAMTDEAAKSIVSGRVERVQKGLYGDVEPCGEGVSELRIDFGPGYRVYFSETYDGTIILLLLGGDKSTQKKDIKEAKKMLADMKKQREAKRKEQEAAAKATAKSERKTPPKTTRRK